MHADFLGQVIEKDTFEALKLDELALQLKTLPT